MDLVQGDGGNELIFDVQGEQAFRSDVIERSMQTPVVVDFWAPWCGPCKTLGPLLERMTNEWGGGFVLAKVNVDDNPDLAMALRVQGIPTVYAFVGGRPVDYFSGALGERELRAFLERVAPPAERDPFEVAEEALADGRFMEAGQAFQAALERHPEGPERAKAILGMARSAMGSGDAQGAGQILDAIDSGDPAYEEAARLKGVLGFSADAGDLAALQAKVDANAKDAEAWYSIGATHASTGNYDAALDAFLQVVKADREYREDGGRNAMVSLFGLLGVDDPITIKHRKRLSAWLF